MRETFLFKCLIKCVVTLQLGTDLYILLIIKKHENNQHANLV